MKYFKLFKSRILAAALSAALTVSVAATPAFAASTLVSTAPEETVQVEQQKSQGEILYDRLLYVIDLIKEYGIYSSEDDDPLRDYLIDLFDQNPDAYINLMDSMLLSQDNHSGYFTTSGHETTYNSGNSYVGIGVTIQATGNGFEITLINSSGNGADKLLRVGDIIVAVDGKSADGLSLDELVSLIRGEAGTSVRLTVLRDGVTADYSIRRVNIVVSHVSRTEIEEGIDYIAIDSFANSTVYSDFIKAYRESLRKGCKALILDLRDNSGGEIDTALNIENSMISTEGIDFAHFAMRDTLGEDITSTSSGLGAPLNKIIVLVNENTASASEFLAAGLRVAENAVLVGTRTYGKSTGQYHISVDDEDVLVLTTLRISVPGEADYIDVGIIPDYNISNNISIHNDTDFLPLDTSAELYMSNYSDNTKALNQRLSFLGFLSANAADSASFGEATLNAINKFQTANGFSRTTYADSATLKAINEAVKVFDGVRVISRDLQYEKALELAIEAAKEPIKYSISWNGTIVRK